MPTVNIEVDATDIVERTADSKGRVAIGPDHAGETVRVAVVETIDESDDNEQ